MLEQSLNRLNGSTSDHLAMDAVRSQPPSTRHSGFTPGPSGAVQSQAFNINAGKDTTVYCLSTHETLS
jgi:hypothetical protein